MAKTPTRTATAPFAHLLSLVTGKSPKAEDDETKTDAEEDESEEKAEEEKPAAEEEESEEKAESEEEGEPKGKRARSTRRAEKDEDEEAEEKAEDSDDDEEMAQARREGFLAAQARGRRIFGTASAAMRPDMAAHFAFNEDMSSAQAIATLDMAANGSAPPASGSRLHRRMARVVTPNPGASGGKKPEEMSFGDMVKAAGEKAGIR